MLSQIQTCSSRVLSSGIKLYQLQIQKSKQNGIDCVYGQDPENLQTLLWRVYERAVTQDSHCPQLVILPMAYKNEHVII